VVSIIAAVSVTVVSIVVIEVSVIVESVASAFFSELQAATDKDIAKAKKPNLNRVFIIILFLGVSFVHFLIPQIQKGNPFLSGNRDAQRAPSSFWLLN